jgi:tetratricopeptide (TPR) repeat protein
MNGNIAATRERVHWYAATVENADRFITPGGVSAYTFGDDISVDGEQFRSFDEALRWFNDERANLIDIIWQANDIGEFQTAAAISDLLCGYFNLTKHWADWITCNELGLAAARSSGNVKMEAGLLMNQGVIYRSLRKPQKAIEYLEPALKLFEQLDDSLGLAYTLQNLANAQSISGDLDKALSGFDRALDIFTTLPDPQRGRAVTLNSKAIAFNHAERYAEAIAAAQEAMDIMREINDAQGLANSLNSLGLAAAGLSRNVEAREHLAEALRIRHDINDGYGEAHTRYEIGRIAAAEGKSIEAEEQWTIALGIFSDLDAPEMRRTQDRLTALRRNK